MCSGAYDLVARLDAPWYPVYIQTPAEYLTRIDWAGAAKPSYHCLLHGSILERLLREADGIDVVIVGV